MNYADLFKDTFQADAPTEYGLVLLKDAWGSEVFLIRGSVPEDVKKLRLPLWKGATEKITKEIFNSSIDSFAKARLSLQDYITVTPKNKAIINTREEISNIYIFEIGKQKLYARKKYFDAVHTLYTGKQLIYQISKLPETHKSRPIIVKLSSDNKLIAVVAPMLFGNDIKIISVIEALRKVFERNMPK